MNLKFKCKEADILPWPTDIIIKINKQKLGLNTCVVKNIACDMCSVVAYAARAVLLTCFFSQTCKVCKTERDKQVVN